MGNQQRSFLRKLGSDSFLRATRLLLGLDYDDYSIAAKAFRVETLRRFADRINEGSSYVLEICYLTKRTGGRIVQVPVSCEDWRQSKFNLVQRGALQVRPPAPAVAGRRTHRALIVAGQRRNHWRTVSARSPTSPRSAPGMLRSASRARLQVFVSWGNVVRTNSSSARASSVLRSSRSQRPMW